MPMVKYGYTERHLRQGTTLRATLGIDYADGQTWLRRGLSAVGTLLHSCSASCLFVCQTSLRDIIQTDVMDSPYIAD
jgi:hypothetical protein